MNLPLLGDYPCGAFLEYHVVSDYFVMQLWSTGGTSITVGNTSSCGLLVVNGIQYGGVSEFVRTDASDPVTFPGHGTITASVKGSTLTITANGVTKRIAIKGYLYAVYIGYSSAVSDAGPFKPASFTHIAITAGGRTAGLRASWLSTTRYDYRGLQTHAIAGGLAGAYNSFTVTRSLN